MATFTICIRNKRGDGFYPVYIRVAHRNDRQYINTGLIVNAKGLKTTFSNKGKQQTEICDPKVLKECLIRISDYAQKINNVNSSEMNCKALINFLTDTGRDLSFTEYAEKFIDKIINEGRDNTANNYKLALTRLKEHVGKNNIYFKDLTTRVIETWIESMKNSARKKNLYPTCIRAIFNAALKEFNDYDYDIIRIRTNPFMRIKIPKDRKPEHRSVDTSLINKILTAELSFSEYGGITRKELAQDVCRIIFCLAGINAADLYDLKSESLKGWKLCYNRKKTRDKSDSSAYMEITVPEIIRPLFKKYKGKKKLFSFSDRICDQNSFARTINKGLEVICNDLKIEENITTYTFRHTWATIAQNECGASTEQIAFAFTHSSAHKVTEKYIRKDYSPVDALNNKVIMTTFKDVTILLLIVEIINEIIDNIIIHKN